MKKNKAIFLDRDGVINKDVGWLYKIKDITILDGVPEAIKNLKEKNFFLVVISNQPVIARGLATEEKIKEINNTINKRLHKKIETGIGRFYFCPHHPNADLSEYRKSCDCRKPLPGMILQASKDYDLDLRQSWMIGDRISDIIAGKSVGCKTVLIKSEKNYEKIEGVEYDLNTEPDFKAGDLFEAAALIE